MSLFFEIMVTYIPPQLIQDIESLKKEGKFEDALKLVNHILVKDPSNKDALMQVADIQYRKWEIHKAEKPIDFILKHYGKDDPMYLYVKWVLEMEKTNRQEAKHYLSQALRMTKFENPEVIRCYGMSEYWYGNVEKWLDLVLQARDINPLDAEIILDLVEIYLLEKKTQKAKKMLQYYRKHISKLQTFDKSKEYYNHKMDIFDKYLHKREEELIKLSNKTSK